MLKIKKVLIMELLVVPISNYPKKHYKIANQILCVEGGEGRGRRGGEGRGRRGGGGFL